MLNIQKKLNCIFYFSKKNHHIYKQSSKMQEDRFKQLMLSLPRELIHRIRDTADGRPEDRYDHVVSHIKHISCSPVCGGENCRYKIIIRGGRFPNSYIVHRQTHAICEVDGCRDSLSLYNHHVCYYHSNIYTPVEYTYFHSQCIPEWDRRKMEREIREMRENNGDNEDIFMLLLL